ncbi:MAG TPA: hypothetical protein VLA79_14885 [Polyangia bacterium]|nr:hypothetical protein [Polyangia bacterium]
MPRYSPFSRRAAPSMTTTPIPIGPGFPEQAPSVQISTADPPDDGAFDGALAGAFAAPLGRRLRSGGASLGGPPPSGSRFPGDGR